MIPDLESQLELLLSELMEIDCQLGEPVRLKLDGTAMSDTEYFAWRSKALRAKRVKTLQYRQLKRNLAAERKKCLTDLPPVRHAASTTTNHNKG